MSAQLRSELLKLRTTRTMAMLLLAAAALTLLGALVEGISRSAAELATESAQRSVFGAAGSVVVIFATLAGIIAVTSEFRYGTIRPTLLVQPRRRIVLAAKLAAGALAGLLFGVACVAVSFGAGFAILAARGVSLALTASHTPALVAGPVAAAAMGAVVGVAVGGLIRNQAGAIVALLGYAFAVDAVLFASVPSVGRFLPGKAGDGLTGQPVADLLVPGAGAAVLLAWALALVVAAIVRTERSDV